MRWQIYILNLTFAIATILAVVLLGPAIETRFYPVYDKIQIVSIVRVPGESHSIVTIRLNKFRNCFPQGYAWYSRDFGKFNRQLNVASTREDGAPMLRAGSYNLKIKVDEFEPADLDSLYAETFSRCHPFWTTVSVIYP